jgi:hypothetical protein
MKDPIQEYIEAYREVFEKEVKRRAKALELDEEVANLGVDVIEKGARKLLTKYGVDIEELEKSNEQLSKRLAERMGKIQEELSHAPENVEEDRRRFALMIQRAACAKQKDPCVPLPPVAIFTDISRTCNNGCRVEVSGETSLGRVYPYLHIRGTGWSGMRTGEITCEYIWTFIPDEAGTYLVNPLLEFHGHYSAAVEYHCYSNSSGTGKDYELAIGHSQESPYPTFTDMDGTLPHVAGTWRYDGVRWPNYLCFLEGGHRTYVNVRLRFRVSARSRYASYTLNFGTPPDENFIVMPTLCYGVFH